MTRTYPPLESVNGSLGSAAWGGTFAPFKLDVLRAASSPVKWGQGARSSLPVPYAAALPGFFFFLWVPAPAMGTCRKRDAGCILVTQPATYPPGEEAAIFHLATAGQPGSHP